MDDVLSTYIYGMAFIAICLVVGILSVFAFWSVENYQTLINSPCHHVTITDTFKDIPEGAGSYITYRYFITDGSNVPYQLLVYTPLEIQKWNQIKFNQSYFLKTHNDQAVWC